MTWGFTCSPGYTRAQCIVQADLELTAIISKHWNYMKYFLCFIFMCLYFEMGFHVTQADLKTHYVGKDGLNRLELLSLLSQPPMCWELNPGSCGYEAGSLSTELYPYSWTPCFETYLVLVTDPDTFLQVEPFPPQTPHLSNFFLESMMWSQPAFTHCPCTQTEVESGLQGVPSTTCRDNMHQVVKRLMRRSIVMATGNALLSALFPCCEYSLPHTPHVTLHVSVFYNGCLQSL